MSYKKLFNKETIDQQSSYKAHGYKLFNIHGELLYVGIAQSGELMSDC